MQLYQLETFIALAEEQNIVPAAKRLNVTPKTVNARIIALESSLGISLFERKSTEEIELTKEGYALTTQVAKVLQESDNLLSLVRELVGEISGTANICLNSSTELLKIDEFFTHMTADHPKLDLQLLRNTSDILFDKIRSEKIDAGYVFGEILHPDEIEQLPLNHYKLVVAGPRSWSDEIKTAQWSDLSELPWVCGPPECPWSKILEQIFESQNFKPTAIANADNEKALINLIISGAGLGLVLEDEAIAAENEGNLAIWKKDSFPIDLTFVYLKKRNTDPLIRSLISTVQKIWQISD